MSQRWVNAIVEVWIPLDGVTVGSPELEKQDAVGRVAEELRDSLPEAYRDAAVMARWEDVTNGVPS